MRREARTRPVFTRRALLRSAARRRCSACSAPGSIRCRSSRAARYATLARQNRVSARMIAPPRGRMLDRFGTVLAGNKQNWRALLIAEQTGDVARHARPRFPASCRSTEHERARIDRDLRRHRRFIPVMVRDFLTWERDGARSR